MAPLGSEDDAHLQREVQRELRREPHLRRADVSVVVRSGVVVLSGAVESPAERLAAQKAAHRVAGVLDVVSDTAVNLPGSPESDGVDIARAVRRALDWSTVIPRQRVHSTLSNGDGTSPASPGRGRTMVVTLEGSVDYYSQLYDAARAVRNVAGVREVKSLIVVDEPPQSPSPLAVRECIEAALDRPPSGVRIAVDTDKVTLEGEVGSPAARSLIEQAARGARGVRRVDNRLRVTAPYGRDLQL